MAFMDKRTICFGCGLLAGFILFLVINQLFLAPVIVPVFSPEDGNEITVFIDGAEESLDIEMYLFTSDDVYDAVVGAHERGVRIRILLEAEPMNNANDEMYRKLTAEGISVKYYSGTRMHSKFIIRDGKEVLVGSHNFSYSALNKNREASVIISGSAVKEFIDIFEEDWLWAVIPVP
jgi:phosphatidylserine/phosphatidylglycerophosphate/cardiolipin synthase-like enzyme